MHGLRLWSTHLQVGRCHPSDIHREAHEASAPLVMATGPAHSTQTLQYPYLPQLTCVVHVPFLCGHRQLRDRLIQRGFVLRQATARAQATATGGGGRRQSDEPQRWHIYYAQRQARRHVRQHMGRLRARRCVFRGSGRPTWIVGRVLIPRERAGSSRSAHTGGCADDGLNE